MDYGKKQPIDREWGEYPLGTKALALFGGHWLKTELGWRWCTGVTFPTPGAEACGVRMPLDKHPESRGRERVIAARITTQVPTQGAKTKKPYNLQGF